MNTIQPAIDVDDKRQEFCQILYSCDDEYSSKLMKVLEWLDATDFFYAPASTIYHLCVPGGLCAHSIEVYRQFDWLCDKYSPTVPKGSRMVMALFHDLCKVHCYNPCRRSRKTGELNQWGKPIWEDYDAYEFVEEFPFGHGEKSVYLLSQLIDLTPEEAIAIRWHMGAYDNAAKSDIRTLDRATTMYPVATLLHVADQLATMLGW